MDFTVNYSLFKNAVSEINKIISSSSIIPILSGIKIEADENGLKLTGSNSDIFIERTIPLTVDEKFAVEIHEFGSVVVLGKYLNEIVKKLPDDIRIKEDSNGAVIIKSNNIESKINGFNSHEYPRLPVMDIHNTVKIEFGTLAKIIKQTVFAVSKSESRPVLTGVNMKFEHDKLICIATDSHRLVRREVDIESNIEESFVVPSTSLIELTHLKESSATVVDIYYSAHFIVFKTVNSTLYSRLIEGNYPNTQTLVPEGLKTTIIMDTKALMEGIDRACVFSSEWKHNNVHLEVMDNLTLKVSSNSTEIGMIEELQKIDHLEGHSSSMHLSMDGEFLIDALKGIEEEKVKISFDSMLKPIVLKPLHSSAFLHLISPLRSR